MTKRTENQVKGDLVEELVETMYLLPNVVIQRKAWLPSLRNPNRRREIDVLATSQVLGRPMKLAFECKNYGKRIGVPKIGEFADKLMDVGIPVQYGIMVASPMGFTSDAQERAKELGIQLLILDGLEESRLAELAHDAFQSVPYLLLKVKRLVVTNDQEHGDTDEMLFLRDNSGNMQGGLLDLIWADWKDGNFPEELGEYEIDIQIPKDWNWKNKLGEFSSTASALVQVSAVVVTERGLASHLKLTDAISGTTERVHVDAKFGLASSPYEVTVVDTEEELERLLNRPAKARIIHGRIRLPRIVFSIYWPPSERVIYFLLDRIHELVMAGISPAGELSKIPIEMIEGTDLSIFWEPIWPQHPAAFKQNWPWKRARRRSNHIRKVSHDF